MAHLIDSMAYVGDTPWHGLGNRLTEKQSIDVWAHEAGMDWKINETPVRFSAQHWSGGEMLNSFADQKVLYRSDTLDALSVVSKRYKVVQPMDILEFYRDLTEQSGFELETAGVLKGGRKLWALARTGQSLLLKGKDVTNGYVLLATACDGTLATTAQLTSVRVVCNNTLAVALGQGSGAVKVPHSTTFDPIAVKQQLGLSVSDWEIFKSQLTALSGRKVKDSETNKYLVQVFSDPYASKDAPPINERAMNRALELFQGHGRGSRLASSQGTAFGLLNAVTEFVDHERRARSTDHRLDSAWFGQGAALKQKAMQTALALLD
jgi:phage/plasmid-like protein (TIGR03299 family)